MSLITQKQIQSVTRRIVQGYQPEKVILFGSYAWGKPSKDSDIDLLIIKKTKKKWLERNLEVRKIIDGELPVDILIRTPEEVRKRLRMGDFFYQDIETKGKYLYEKK